MNYGPTWQITINISHSKKKNNEQNIGFIIFAIIWYFYSCNIYYLSFMFIGKLGYILRRKSHCQLYLDALSMLFENDEYILSTNKYHIHIYVCKYIQTYIHRVNMYVCVVCVHIHMHKCIYISIHIQTYTVNMMLMQELVTMLQILIYNKTAEILADV